MKLKSNAQIARENAAKRAEKEKGKKSGKVRYVRTAAGEKRFGRSIGDVIVAGEKMQNIKHEDPVYPGWDLIKGKNGVKYDVGKINGKFVAYVHNSQDGLAITADTHEDLLRQLNSRVVKVKQTITPKYEREGRQKRFAPDGTPIETEDDGAQGLTRNRESSTSARKGTSARSGSQGTRNTSSRSSSRETARKAAEREREARKKQAAKNRAIKAAEKGEYEGTSLTGIRQLMALAMGTGGKDGPKNRKHSEALMKILEKQGLIQPAKKTARKDPLGERRGRVSSAARKWEPAEGFTMSQVARSIKYDINIDRILFQWDEDRRNSKG